MTKPSSFSSDGTIAGIVGESQYMQDLRREIRRVAQTDFPVLIQGEPGTGKDIIARAIHSLGPRRQREMISANCGTLSSAIDEEEFFGSKKAAHGGAWPSKMGLIAAANHSTLFLNEIGALSRPLQEKMLKIIETGEFYPDWSRDPRMTDLRILAAASADVALRAAHGEFLPALLERLRGAVISTLPLHEHREDIPDLIDHFISIKEDQKIPRRISPIALEMLVEHSWPGNLRELQYTIEVICIASMGLRAISEKAVRTVLKINDTVTRTQETYQEAKAGVLHEFEVNYFTKLLHHYKGNINQAAGAAGMYRPNMLAKLRQLNIEPNAFRRKAFPKTR